MSLYIPRLRRAVSDFLQLPLQETTSALEIIQECLYDARTVNSVYHLLVSQASREPFSPFLVEKSVCFMRRHLFRFPPSSETLVCISQFCEFSLKLFVNRELDAPQTLQRSLLFLQALVERLNKDANLISANAQCSDELSNSLKPSTLATAPSWELGMNGGGPTESENGDVSSLGLGSRLGSTSNLAGAAGSVGAVSNPAQETSTAQIVRRTKTPVGAPMTPAKRTESAATRAMWLSSVGSGLPMNDTQMHRRSRSGSLAEQFVQEILKFRPPLIWMPNGTNRPAPDGEDDSWQNVTSMRGLMCIEHLWTVAGMQMQSGSSSGEVRKSGSSTLGSGPLFQYRNYEEQESLQLHAKDITLVIDTVWQSSADTSIWGEMEAELWSSDTSKSIGEACITILIKLIMDMYLEYGPGVAYGLVLQMLHQALMSEDPAVRVRAFDLVYNLSLHSLMMSSTSGVSFFEKCEETQKDPIRHDSREATSPERHPMRKLHTLKEETEGLTSPDDDPLVYLMPWVRSLLFDLLTILAQLDEGDVSVWSAAMGCFFHLATANGEFVICYLRNFPVSVLAKALRICIQAGWSDEIYSQLLRLWIKLLSLSQDSDRMVNEARLAQCGGIQEVVYHLRTTRSMLDVSHLVQFVIDYTLRKTNYGVDSVTPLLSNLLLAPAMDVIVARCRHGEKGVGDIIQMALQNCIIEKNILQDSPKKPMHHRYRSQSSFLSSETPTSIQPGVDPESLDSWKTILDEIDGLLTRPADDEEHCEQLSGLGDPVRVSQGGWQRLEDLMSSELHQDRVIGIQWILQHCMGHLPDRLREEDRTQMSLLPEPPTAEVPEDGNLVKVLQIWVGLPYEQVGIEMCLLLEGLVSRLVTLSQPLSEDLVPSDLPPRTVVHRLGTLLFRTLFAGLLWIRFLPFAARRRPMLCISFHVCQIVHAPHIISDLSLTPPIEGLSSPSTPFVYSDYIFGAGSVYIRLLRLAPIDFLLELILDLKHFCLPYHDEVGFHGRPGHKGEMKHGQTNVPWTDTVSDLRAALVLLLLHRCNVDFKAKGKMEDICKSLLHDTDVRVCYVASRHLLKYILEENPTECRAALRKFVAKAQQMNNERLVDNPYLQVKHILGADTPPQQF